MANIIVTSRGWPAPAKLNLFLHIIGRRADGYHLLQTIFQFIELADSIHFEINSSGKLKLETSYSDITPEDDLVLRAAKILQEKTGCKSGANITVEKNLPIGGGLGGGSSDAATTLVALNKLWKCELNEDQLARIGVELGADIPIFIYGHAAWAEGVGEQLTAVEPVESCYLVVRPDCQVSTQEIFNSEDLTRNTPAITIRDSLTGSMRNDCEPVVRRLHPQVAEAQDWLSQYAETRMTGTGACIFAVFENRKQAETVLDELPPPWQGFVTRGQNRSPLIERLQQEN